jgi:hypothetical protein
MRTVAQWLGFAALQVAAVYCATHGPWWMHDAGMIAFGLNSYEIGAWRERQQRKAKSARSS